MTIVKRGMAELFGCLIKNIYIEGDLDENATTNDFSAIQAE